MPRCALIMINIIVTAYLMVMTTVAAFGGLGFWAYIFSSTTILGLSISLQLTCLFYSKWIITINDTEEYDVGEELKSLIDAILGFEGDSYADPELDGNRCYICGDDAEGRCNYGRCEGLICGDCTDASGYCDNCSGEMLEPRVSNDDLVETPEPHLKAVKEKVDPDGTE